MNKEHTIVNGANRLGECAEYIRETFSAQGYSVDIVKSKDIECNGLFVQVCNMNGSVGSLVKLATGLNVGVVLKMWTSGSDLKFHTVRSKWINPTVLATASILPGPFEFTGLLGILILTPLSIVGCRNQRRLLEKVFTETMSFLTAE